MHALPLALPRVFAVEGLGLEVANLLFRKSTFHMRPLSGTTKGATPDTDCDHSYQLSRVLD